MEKGPILYLWKRCRDCEVEAETRPFVKFSTELQQNTTARELIMTAKNKPYPALVCVLKSYNPDRHVLTSPESTNVA